MGKPFRRRERKLSPLSTENRRAGPAADYRRAATHYYYTTERPPYSSFLLFAKRADKKYGISAGDILVELGRGERGREATPLFKVGYLTVTC